MMRLLIVEDDFLISQGLSMAVSALGHEVVGTAAVSDDAVELAKQHRPVAALVDIRLARNSSGIDAARGMFEVAGVRSLYTTAHKGDCRVVPGALGCLLKPYNHTEIKAALGIVENVLRCLTPDRPPLSMDLYPENFPTAPVLM